MSTPATSNMPRSRISILRSARRSPVFLTASSSNAGTTVTWLVGRSMLKRNDCTGSLLSDRSTLISDTFVARRAVLMNVSVVSRANDSNLPGEYGASTTGMDVEDESSLSRCPRHAEARTRTAAVKTQAKTLFEKPLTRIRSRPTPLSLSVISHRRSRLIDAFLHMKISTEPMRPQVDIRCVLVCLGVRKTMALNAVVTPLI